MSWSFCIISVGISPYLQSSVDSIRQHGPSDSEIIVIGGDLIPQRIDAWHKFDESIKPGWITRKKNLAAKLASCNSVVMLHDYVSLCENWGKAMENFVFPYTCMTRVLNKDGKRFRDWCAIGNDAWMKQPIDNQPVPQEIGEGRLLRYDNNAYGRWQYSSGAYMIAKRFVWLELPFDEERVWAGGEDVELSRRWYQRYKEDAFKMNPAASVQFFKQKDNAPWEAAPEL